MPILAGRENSVLLRRKQTKGPPCQFMIGIYAREGSDNLVENPASRLVPCCDSCPVFTDLMHESAQGPPDQGTPDQGTPREPDQGTSDQGTSDQGTSGPGLVRADCGEQSSGSRCELHARPAIAKICRFADLQICRFAWERVI